jgi:predicted NUDIX family NTP pyrophosphohydrolase
VAPRKTSAGILLYRFREGRCEVLLVHPGGPFWTHRDLGSWSVPKGEIGEGEEPLAAARREFEEETGFHLDGPFRPLRPITQKGGKVVLCWTREGSVDAEKARSITFPLEWPPHSGRIEEFPEVDRAAFFTLDEARRRINPGQVPFLSELQALLSPAGNP